MPGASAADASLRVARECASALNCETASLFILDPRVKLLRAYINRSTEISVRVGEGVAGYCAKHNEVVVVNDAYKDKRFSRKTDNDSNFVTNDMLAVPVHDEAGSVIAVLEVINKKGGIKYDLMDELMLMIIADITGPMVHQLRILSKIGIAKMQQERIMNALPGIWSSFAFRFTGIHQKN